MSTTTIENSREGWSKTRGWSKRVHYFQAERSLCSGSAPAEGELERDPGKVDGVICADCLAHAPSRQTGKVGPRKGKARIQ